MKKVDLVFSCRKCEQNLFLSGGVTLTGKQIAIKLNSECDNCGEEAGGLWIFERLGNYDKEYGK